MEHIEELYHVFIAAYNSWPAKYRPQFTHENMITLAQALKNDKQMIPLLYSMRKLLIKFDNLGVFHQVNAILKMEEIVRNQT